MWISGARRLIGGSVDALGERVGHGALVRSSGLGCGFSAGGLVGVQLLFLYWVVAWL